MLRGAKLNTALAKVKLISVHGPWSRIVGLRHVLKAPGGKIRCAFHSGRLLPSSEPGLTLRSRIQRKFELENRHFDSEPDLSVLEQSVLEELRSLYSPPSMKHAIVALLFVMLLLRAQADDTPYRAAVKSAHKRYEVLSRERVDYRKTKPGLPAPQEEEYLRLLGQLSVDDPVWALAQQIQADIDALVAVRSRTPADDAILDNLKDLLAITASVEDRANTREEAERIATVLRQFIIRRDVAGARAWVKSRPVAEQLIRSAEFVAVVSMTDVPKAMVNDAGLDLSVFPQKARARVERPVFGNVSGEIVISNQRDSALAPGKYLAFLVRTGEQFRLSSATSLRRIKGGEVYWFPAYAPVSEVIAEIGAMKETILP